VNKRELTTEAAASTGAPPRVVADVIDALLASIERAVVAGDRVVLAGFGTFLAQERAPRTARHISEGRPLHVPPTRVPAFRPGRPFREAVASGGPRRPARR